MSPPQDKRTWTVGSVLTWAANDFRKRGRESARLDAELLLARALRVDRITLIIEHQRPLVPQELSDYRALIQRRRNAEPIAYILGFREFYGHEFNVDPRVLIPRPDTETLVETALRRVDTENSVRALDLCTGSGCVAISLQLARASWNIVASDQSEGAVEVARANAAKLKVADTLDVVQSDLFSSVPQHLFHLITANPPYIPDGEVAELQPDVREYEPHLALKGGQDGLNLVRSLLEQAREYLAPSGILALEVGHDQASKVGELLASFGYGKIELDQDYAGIERVVSAVWDPTPATTSPTEPGSVASVEHATTTAL